MIRLEDTNGSAVAAEIAAERHRMGSPATGMVLNLLVITDEENQADATSVAAFSAQEHPMRILVLIPRRGRVKPRLGPGEIAVLRLHGELSQHPGSVAIPLLLSDTPVVAYWPNDAPDVPHQNTIGAHAQRRITDATAAARQMQALSKRVKGYSPGDTDLAWTMTTAWRTLLAATLDQPHPPIIGAEVSLPKTHASGHLLASWLGSRLQVPASVVNSKGPGITSVRLITAEGDIAIARPDGGTARLSRPGMPAATIALPRRSRADAMTEELRRLDPDEIYGEALAGLSQVKQGRLKIDRPGAPVTKKSKKRSARDKKAGAKK